MIRLAVLLSLLAGPLYAQSFAGITLGAPAPTGFDTGQLVTNQTTDPPTRTECLFYRSLTKDVELHIGSDGCGGPVTWVAVTIDAYNRATGPSLIEGMTLGKTNFADVVALLGSEGYQPPNTNTFHESALPMMVFELSPPDGAGLVLRFDSTNEMTAIDEPTEADFARLRAEARLWSITFETSLEENSEQGYSSFPSEGYRPIQISDAGNGIVKLAPE